jgi:transitional endoplasmic reticulum ATPase
MAFDPSLCHADCDLSTLAERIAGSSVRAVSFCLYGLSGTGKSAFARHLAERMGLEIVEKSASDLKSMWVGETEKRIAEAFREAADKRSFLILDEADSLLRDRGGAQQSWEVSQVNEMLLAMERHPYPFACTTNLMDSLDPATLRRFLFKVRFLPMTPAQARDIFRRVLNAEPPAELEALGPLAPGDFTLVARRAELMEVRAPDRLLAMLREEVEAKPYAANRPIGFTARLH